MARTLQAACLALAALMLSGCAFAEDKAPDYRYRLTVEVETSEGVKTGSSVIAVEQSIGRTAMDGFVGGSVFLRIRGEAVAVDLPDGRTLYALLRSGGDVEWAARVIPFLSPDAKDYNPLDDFLLLEGKKELPRKWSAQGPFNNASAYPMMVTFGDLTDPTSVAEVDPDDLAATFGAGVKLKRITVELTDDPVTTGIEERLGWMDAYRKKWFDGTSTISEDLTTDDLTAHLTAGSFSTEFAK